MSPCRLLVTYTAKPGQREAFLQAVAESGAVAKIRAEDGCLGYAYYRAVDDPDVVLLVEAWASAEQQTRHLAQPHMADIMAAKERYVRETGVTRYHQD